MQSNSSDPDPTDVKTRAARLISNLVSPPMVFAVLGFLLAWTALPFWLGTLWGAVYGFFVSLVPLILVIFMYKLGMVEDLHMSDIRQRRVPYLVGVSGAGITYLLVRLLDGPPILGVLALSNVLGLGALGVINNFWLISSHMGSITTATLFVGLVYGVFAGLVLSPLIVLVFFARWTLRRHTIAQLIAGSMVGVGTIWILVYAGLL